jgi:hypothetical protein
VCQLAREHCTSDLCMAMISELTSAFSCFFFCAPVVFTIHLLFLPSASGQTYSTFVAQLIQREYAAGRPAKPLEATTPSRFF